MTPEGKKTTFPQGVEAQVGDSLIVVPLGFKAVLIKETEHDDGTVYE